MIKILCQTMTSNYDSSCKVRIMIYESLESFKQEVLKHYPKISISLPKENEEYWFGIKYGDTEDGFLFRWLKAIVDTERGCLYSLGDIDCVHQLALPAQKQHCSKEVYALLKSIKDEVERRKKSVVFVDEALKNEEDDVLQEKMESKDFVWSYKEEISFQGKDENGYYTVCVNGLENDNYDVACYMFKDYNKLKKFIAEWFGDSYYGFLCGAYEAQS